MDLKKTNHMFPIGSGIEKGKIITLVVVCGIYLIAAAAIKFVASVLGWFPFIGWILHLVSWIFGIYCAIGIVVAIIKYFGE